MASAFLFEIGITPTHFNFSTKEPKWLGVDQENYAILEVQSVGDGEMPQVYFNGELKVAAQ
jgi:hypothetical protein